MNKRYKLIFYLSGALVLILFCYFRLKPIYFQTVPYTFDQGRDFIQAAAIARDHNFTLLGPTTGIQGLFHGAWWYYFLATVYFLTNGAPTGFYLGMFFVHFLAVILFVLFLKKKLGPALSLLFLLVVTVSSYFIQASFLPANNSLALIAVLLYLYALFMTIEQKGGYYLLLLGFSLGFIFETEVSFGLLFIPVFIISSLLFKQLRLFWKDAKSILYFLTGLLIPFTPRILFELRNQFLQSNAIINFLQHPTTTNLVTFKGAFFDRLDLFSNYFQQVFSHSLLALLFISVFIIGSFFAVKARAKEKAVFLILVFQVILLFFVSLLQKNNFFWSNYFEGLQYIFLFLVLLSVKLIERNKILRPLKYLFIIIFATIALFNFMSEAFDKKSTPLIGLRENISTVQRIYLLSGNDDLCVRVYTPPIIDYTYSYLFDYYSQSRNFIKPVEYYVKNQCWYIVERESYEFRVRKWRAENIPSGAQILKKEIISDNIHIELWQEKK